MLQKIIKDGTETGGSLADKINLGFDAIDAIGAGVDYELVGVPSALFPSLYVSTIEIPFDGEMMVNFKGMVQTRDAISSKGVENLLSTDFSYFVPSDAATANLPALSLTDNITKDPVTINCTYNAGIITFGFTTVDPHILILNVKTKQTTTGITGITEWGTLAPV